MPQRRSLLLGELGAALGLATALTLLGGALPVFDALLAPRLAPGGLLDLRAVEGEHVTRRRPNREFRPVFPGDRPAVAGKGGVLARTQSLVELLHPRAVDVLLRRRPTRVVHLRVRDDDLRTRRLEAELALDLRKPLDDPRDVREALRPVFVLHDVAELFHEVEGVPLRCVEDHAHDPVAEVLSLFESLGILLDRPRVARIDGEHFRVHVDREQRVGACVQPLGVADEDLRAHGLESNEVVCPVDRAALLGLLAQVAALLVQLRDRPPDVTASHRLSAVEVEEVTPRVPPLLVSVGVGHGHGERRIHARQFEIHDRVHHVHPVVLLVTEKL